MSQSDKSFTVSDRRHFTAEGRPREDDAATAEPIAPEAPQERAAEQDRVRAAQEPVDFSSFVLGLAAQVGRLLTPADSAPAAEALAAARQIVGILEMLKGKTEGRLTPEEGTLLEELLFQLRMAYVERARMEKP